MKPSLSARVGRIKPSPTLAVTARAQELRREGRDVIGLGAGEPDFDTPDHIKAAAIEAIHQGFTKYTAVDGIIELREAISDKFRRDNEIEYAPDQILVSVGGKHSLYNLFEAVLNPGDEVIIPAPYWVSYPAMALLADAEPVIVSAGSDQGFKLRPEQLASAIEDQTRLFVLNSPSNPTGAAYTRPELEALAEVLREHPRVLIVTDDMYEHIYWGSEPFCSFLTAAPDLYERTITINGVSKVYSMTGWRIGYAGGPAAIIAAMRKIQSQSTSNPCAIAQKAALAAISGDQTCVTEMNEAFKQRHDYLVAELNEIPGFRCLPGAGTFYAFPDITGALETLPDISGDIPFSEFLLEKAEVAVVPGSAFGAPGHIRLSFACGEETLETAVGRIRSALQGAGLAA
ncbi:MAG: pyridoxal phosphate-dependent aminotransferase [Gammaproteobacteria bacterium]|nr:MAG: pyridoxal phosphate-dependent aminotransferase [Gammaproteobacteria bacterium]